MVLPGPSGPSHSRASADERAPEAPRWPAEPNPDELKREGKFVDALPDQFLELVKDIGFRLKHELQCKRQRAGLPPCNFFDLKAKEVHFNPLAGKLRYYFRSVPEAYCFSNPPKRHNTMDSVCEVFVHSNYMLELCRDNDCKDKRREKERLEVPQVIEMVREVREQMSRIPDTGSHENKFIKILSSGRRPSARIAQGELIPEPERHEMYIRLLSQLGLNEVGKIAMRARGCSWKWMQRVQGWHHIKTWPALEPVPAHAHVDPYLPGVLIDERRKTIVHHGIPNGGPAVFFPVLDVHGNINTCIIMLPLGDPKYDTPGKKNEKPCYRLHQNGETPLAVWRTMLEEGEADAVPPSTLVCPATRRLVKVACLSEGIVKSFVAASHFGLLFVGAGIGHGGDFAGSPQTLRAILRYEDPDEVWLCPDAGSLDNATIVLQYLRAVRLLRNHNYRVFVAWWGQRTKGAHVDVDELRLAARDAAGAVRIQLVRPHEFFDLATGEPSLRALHNDRYGPEDRRADESPAIGEVYMTQDGLRADLPPGARALAPDEVRLQESVRARTEKALPQFARLVQRFKKRPRGAQGPQGAPATGANASTPGRPGLAPRVPLRNPPTDPRGRRACAGRGVCLGAGRGRGGGGGGVAGLRDRPGGGPVGPPGGAGGGPPRPLPHRPRRPPRRRLRPRPAPARPSDALGDEEEAAEEAERRERERLEYRSRIAARGWTPDDPLQDVKVVIKKVEYVSGTRLLVAPSQGTLPAPPPAPAAASKPPGALFSPRSSSSSSAAMGPPSAAASSPSGPTPKRASQRGRRSSSPSPSPSPRSSASSNAPLPLPPPSPGSSSHPAPQRRSSEESRPGSAPRAGFRSHLELDEDFMEEMFEGSVAVVISDDEGEHAGRPRAMSDWGEGLGEDDWGGASPRDDPSPPRSPPRSPVTPPSSDSEGEGEGEQQRGEEQGRGEGAPREADRPGAALQDESSEEEGALPPSPRRPAPPAASGRPSPPPGAPSAAPPPESSSDDDEVGAAAKKSRRHSPPSSSSPAPPAPASGSSPAPEARVAPRSAPAPADARSPRSPEPQAPPPSIPPSDGPAMGATAAAPAVAAGAPASEPVERRAPLPAAATGAPAARGPAAANGPLEASSTDSTAPASTPEAPAALAPPSAAGLPLAGRSVAPAGTAAAAPLPFKISSKARGFLPTPSRPSPDPGESPQEAPAPRATAPRPRRRRRGGTRAVGPPAPGPAPAPVLGLLARRDEILARPLRDRPNRARAAGQGRYFGRNAAVDPARIAQRDAIIAAEEAEAKEAAARAGAPEAPAARKRRRREEEEEFEGRGGASGDEEVDEEEGPGAGWAPTSRWGTAWARRRPPRSRPARRRRRRAGAAAGADAGGAAGAPGGARAGAGEAEAGRPRGAGGPPPARKKARTETAAPPGPALGGKPLYLHRVEFDPPVEERFHEHLGSRAFVGFHLLAATRLTITRDVLLQDSRWDAPRQPTRITVHQAEAGHRLLFSPEQIRVLSDFQRKFCGAKAPRPLPPFPTTTPDKEPCFVVPAFRGREEEVDFEALALMLAYRSDRTAAELVRTDPSAVDDRVCVKGRPAPEPPADGHGHAVVPLSNDAMSLVPVTRALLEPASRKRVPPAWLRLKPGLAHSSSAPPTFAEWYRSRARALEYAELPPLAFMVKAAPNARPDEAPEGYAVNYVVPELVVPTAATSGMFLFGQRLAEALPLVFWEAGVAGFVSNVQRVMGADRFAINEIPLLRQALTHASMAPRGLPDNERLEHLGDAVLELVARSKLFLWLPELSGLELLDLRDALVSNDPLCTLAERLGVRRALLRNTERLAEGDAMLGDAVEAVIGALFLKERKGLMDAATFVTHFILEQGLQQYRPGIWERISKQGGGRLERCNAPRAGERQEPMLRRALEELAEDLGFPAGPGPHADWLTAALRFEGDGRFHHGRLVFLGDGVRKFLLTAHLYFALPGASLKALSETRKKVEHGASRYLGMQTLPLEPAFVRGLQSSEGFISISGAGDEYSGENNLLRVGDALLAVEFAARGFRIKRSHGAGLSCPCGVDTKANFAHRVLLKEWSWLPDTWRRIQRRLRSRRGEGAGPGGAGSSASPAPPAQGGEEERAGAEAEAEFLECLHRHHEEVVERARRSGARGGFGDRAHMLAPLGPQGEGGGGDEPLLDDVDSLRDRITDVYERVAALELRRANVGNVSRDERQRYREDVAAIRSQAEARPARPRLPASARQT
eukprot:tig00000128_g7219.t1